MENHIEPVIEKKDGLTKTVFISNDSFTVTRLEIEESGRFQDDNYQLATVIKGHGKANDIDIKLGDNFLIPKGLEVQFAGKMTIMMTTK